MESGAGGGDRAPDPVARGRFIFHLDPLDKAQLVANDGIEGPRVGDWKKNQVDFSALEIQRRQIGIFREPDGIGQADDHRVMVAGKRLGAEESIAQAAWPMLHGEEYFRGVIMFSKVTDDVRFF